MKKFLKNTIGEICSADPIIFNCESSLEDVAKLMTKKEVSVVLIEKKGQYAVLIPHAILAGINRKCKLVSDLKLDFADPIDNELNIMEAITRMRANCIDYLVILNKGNVAILAANNILNSIQDLSLEHDSLKSEIEELKKRLDEKDEYIGIVSHDIRSPLSIIGICCDYLLSMEDAGSKLLSEQRIFIDRVKTNVNKALDLVGRILDVSSLSHNNELEKSETDLDVYVSELVENQVFLADKKNIDLSYVSNESLMILLDRTRIEQVLENLIGNAIKFTPAGRKIKVIVSKLEKNEQQYAKIAVADEGYGIPAEDVDRIFDKFAQLDSGVAKKMGVGLGLAIAAQYVKYHGGYIDVESLPGEGACFSIMLPLLDEELSSDAVDQYRILIVDDDVDIREFYSDIVGSEGYSIVSAENGLVAMDKIRHLKPDLVISDIRMPEMDGFELLASIRLIAPDMPVILCSGQYPNLNDDIANSIFKANKVLEKPVETETLLRSIENLLPPITETKKVSS